MCCRCRWLEIYATDKARQHTDLADISFTLFTIRISLIHC